MLALALLLAAAVLGNLLADLVNGLLDPRASYD